MKKIKRKEGRNETQKASERHPIGPGRPIK
jgi:hypothetical protein